MPQHAPVAPSAAINSVQECVIQWDDPSLSVPMAFWLPLSSHNRPPARLQPLFASDKRGFRRARYAPCGYGAFATEVGALRFSLSPQALHQASSKPSMIRASAAEP